MFFLCVCAAALLQEQWEALAGKLSQTQQQIRACETAMVFAFVEVKPKRKKKRTQKFMTWSSSNICAYVFFLGNISTGSEEGPLDPT